MLATGIQVPSELEGRKEQGEEGGGGEKRRVLTQPISGARKWGRGEGIPGKITTPKGSPARSSPRSLLPKMR